MNILIDCSNYFIRWSNLGDIALFQAAGRRLSELFPTAWIHIVTGAPALIREQCHPLEPLPYDNIHAREWFAPGKRSGWPLDGLWPVTRQAVALARRLNCPALTRTLGPSSH
jgi:hypothetical protein